MSNLIGVDYSLFYFSTSLSHSANKADCINEQRCQLPNAFFWFILFWFGFVFLRMLKPSLALVAIESAALCMWGLSRMLMVAGILDDITSPKDSISF